MKSKIIIGILVIISLWRLAKEVLILQVLPMTSSQKLECISAIFLLILLYVLPLSLLVLYLLKKEGKSIHYFCIAFIFGGLVIGHLSGILNFRLIDEIKHLFPYSKALVSWLPSIVPPVVEESLKAGLAFLLLVCWKQKDIRQFFIIGLGTGLGFQFSEDYTYIIGGIVDREAPIRTALLRMETAYASHWALTAILVVGIYFLLHGRHIQKKWQTALCLVSPLFLHIAWNSPYIDGNMILKISLTLLTWMLLAYLLRQLYGFKKYEETVQ